MGSDAIAGMKWAVFALALFAAMPAGSADERPYAVTEERADCADFEPLRRPLFGDTHVHTTYSFDANFQDTRNTPRDAYRFARGEPMGIQPYDDDGNPQRTIRIDRPLDWAMISDHAELMGEVYVCSTPGTWAYWHPACLLKRSGFPTLAIMTFGVKTLTGKSRFGWLCGEDGARCVEGTRRFWTSVQDAAEEAYDRSDRCEFTSFVGYEWTASVGKGQNLHRNVVFRNANVPELPISWVDTPSAFDLWDRLEADCIEGLEECDVFTIPHNSNLSGGLFFQSARIESEDDVHEMDGEEARRRARFEPIAEIMQHKGASECDSRAGWGNDEACGFELLPYDRFGAKGNFGLIEAQLPNANNYLRWALKQGLLRERELGANPFRYGIIASTDSHIAAPGLTREKGHPGHGGAGMGAGEGLTAGFPDDIEFNPGGLAVAWAEENTRDAIFSAMQRREVYGTSGTRPVVRFFGGWEYPGNLCDRDDFVAAGYAGGVPMGGTLPRAPGGVFVAPRFAVSALRDPGTAEDPGTPLQRIQIVKGWTEGGATHERVIDVVGGENGASVDLDSCQARGAGADQLCSVWYDADFDPTESAFYYARVLENPTCRWSQYVCLDAKVNCSEPESVPEALAACCDEAVPKTLQERAWTSPIWYTP